MHPNTILGGLCLIFGCLLLFIWTPLDAETGMVEYFRRRYTIGDGLAPSFAAVVFLVAGALLVFGAKPADAPRLTGADARYLGAVMALGLGGLLIMRYAGPAATWALGAEDYRLLRDTAPWKHIGFALGGTVMVAGLIALVEGRVTRGGVLTALLAVAAIIALYDLPFDDLLLPPNGDV